MDAALDHGINYLDAAPICGHIEAVERAANRFGPAHV